MAIMGDSQTVTNRLLYSFQHQLTKFQKIGKYKYISLVNFILLFTLLPALLGHLWPLIQNALPPLYLYLVIIVFLNCAENLAYNFAMYFIYTRKIPFFQQFRSDSDRKWIWEENPQKWRSYFIKTLKIVCFNILIVTPLFTWVTNLSRFDIRVKIQECPQTLTMVWQCSLFLLVTQALFYFVHRVLHSSAFYWIHKQHHEYNTTIALAMVYANPIEHIIANLITNGIGYTLLSRVYPVHMITVVVWLTFRLIQSSDGHCGYDWPWALSHWIPFSGGGNYHYFHHSQNSGNYGAIIHLFDTLMGTNHQYIEKEKTETIKLLKNKKV